MELLVAKIVLEMREYQRINNIVNKCVTNTQLLYDMMSDFGIKNIKVDAVIAIRPPDLEIPQVKICAGHLVIMIDDVLIDPSYEIYSMPNKLYVHNIKELSEYLKSYNDIQSQNTLKNSIEYCIDHHLRFKTHANKINNGIKYADDDYYSKLKKHLLHKFKDYIGLEQI